MCIALTVQSPKLQALFIFSFLGDIGRNFSLKTKKTKHFTKKNPTLCTTPTKHIRQAYPRDKKPTM